MQSYSDFLQSSLGEKEPKNKKRQRQSKTDKVLEDLQYGKYLTQRKIAERVGCHETFVSKIKRQDMMGRQLPWFHNHMSNIQKLDISSFTLDQTVAYTSNLTEDVPLREITAEELDEHKLNISEISEKAVASKKEYLRRGLFQGARKKIFHGFVAVEQCMSEKDVKAFSKIHEKELPALFASKKYRAAEEYGACFTNIFEYAQLAPLSAGEKRGDDEMELERRMGDKKRYQAKLSDLLKTAKERVDAVQNAVDQSASKASKTKRGLIIQLSHVKKEEALLLDLLRFMRMHYHCIRKVQNTISMLKDETLILSRAAGLAGKCTEARSTPRPFCCHSLTG